MVFNTHLIKQLSPEDKALYGRVIDLDLVNLIDPPHLKYKTPTVECHSICRAFAMLIPELRVVDGAYCGIAPDDDTEAPRIKLITCRHSWLVMPSGHIIDPYPVGCLVSNPILVISTGLYRPFGAGLYRESAQATDDIKCRKLWRKACVYASLLRESARKAGVKV